MFFARESGCVRVHDVRTLLFLSVFLRSFIPNTCLVKKRSAHGCRDALNLAPFVFCSSPLDRLVVF